MSAHVLQDELFSTFDPRERLDNQRSRLDEALAALDEHRLLNTAPNALIDYFIAAYRIEPPALRRHEWQAETDDHADFEGNAASHRLDIDIPFDGDAEWFGAQAGPWTGTSGAVRISGQSLVLTFEIKRGAEQAARALIDREVNEIEKALAWIRQEVNAYNDSLQLTVETTIQTRRQQILAHQELIASLGIPLRKHSDSSVDRLITPVPKTLPAFPPMSNEAELPELTLTPDHIGQIIDTLSGAIRLLSHSPSLYASINEERLRDYVLVPLNGQFEYADGNNQDIFETLGHSTIGLRSGVRFALLVQLLFWTNAKAFTQVAEQVLNHPLCRGASIMLLVFSRTRTISRPLNDIRSAMSAHPLCISAANEQPEDSCSFTLQRPGAPDHSVHLCVRIFKAPKAKPGPARAKRTTHKNTTISQTQARFDF